MPEQIPSPTRKRRRRLSFDYDPPVPVLDAVTALKQRTQLPTTSGLFGYLVLLGERLYQHKKAGGKIVLINAKGDSEELRLL